MPEQDTYFTDGRVPDVGIRPLFTLEHRWQRWLDVEAALAEAEAEVGIIPHAAAQAIRKSAALGKLNVGQIKQDRLAMSHKLMALISELSKVVGEPHGRWVHWGATTQNITQTGDVLVLREAHSILCGQLGKIMDALADLAQAGAGMAMAGRSHGQQAVPITFGLKVATWIDELSRNVERLEQAEPRVFTAMMGGAVGSYGSLGEQGPLVQAAVAQQLRLESMEVPARSMSDSFAEYVSLLGLLAGTCGRIAAEVYTLMKTEFGEVREPAPQGTIGSSTMPHKYNPQLTDECVAIAAQIRALVPLALEGMLHDHEANSANEHMTETAVRQACILSGDLLARLSVVLSGLELDEQRMRTNLGLAGGLITSEAVMLALGEIIGRQQAHEVVYEAAQSVVRQGKTFAEVLASDPRITAHLDEAAIQELLDPLPKTGLSKQIAELAAVRSRQVAAELNARTASED